MPRTRGATIVELVVVLAVVALLLTLLMPTLSTAREQSRQVVCLAQERQVASAALHYAAEHDQRLPSDPAAWARRLPWFWDLPHKVKGDLTARGVPRQTFYCPSNPEQDSDELWDWRPYGVVGYFILWEKNGNATRLDRHGPALQDGYVVRVDRDPGSSVELLADGTLSVAGSFTGVRGGWRLPHRSNHLLPGGVRGGNILFLDGHGAWRSFADMHVRTAHPRQYF